MFDCLLAAGRKLIKYFTRQGQKLFIKTSWPGIKHMSLLISVACAQRFHMPLAVEETLDLYVSRLWINRASNVLCSCEQIFWYGHNPAAIGKIYQICRIDEDEALVQTPGYGLLAQELFLLKVVNVTSWVAFSCCVISCFFA